MTSDSHLDSKYKTDLPYEPLLALIKEKPIPCHVAIIMDGNGRWATQNKLPRLLGHRQGMKALTDIVEASHELGVKHLTLYAFSTENWKRPVFEINALMGLMFEFLQRFIRDLHNNRVKLTILGDITPIPEYIKEKIIDAIELTKHNSGLHLNIAFNYGARMEIIRGIKAAIMDVQQGKLFIDDLDENKFNQYLYTFDTPDPDLLIRTGGELRLSNFLLYQAAYSELLFTGPDLLWPDFSKSKYLQSILEYQCRYRRYGGINTE